MSDQYVIGYSFSWNESYIRYRSVVMMSFYSDRSRMPLNHAEMITASTHVCNDCYDKLVGFLFYWFRITLPRNHLPADVAGGKIVSMDRHVGHNTTTKNMLVNVTMYVVLPEGTITFSPSFIFWRRKLLIIFWG